MIPEKIKQYFDKKSHVKISRTIDKTSRGYILGYSTDFILVQETDDFTVVGYIILPVNQIKNISCGKNEQYYTKVMIWEGEADKIGINHKIQLDSWEAIFSSIKKTNLNIIVECEDADIDIFTIGPILKITKKKVHIEHFDASGFIDEDPVKIDFQDITRVNFDDRYINVLSKYLRKRKSKTK
jgi:hypothetical protein